MAIGPILRALLEKRGLNPYRLAAISGVNANHIGLMLSGKIASPRGDTLVKLAKALGVEPGDLVESESPVSESSPPFSAGADHDAARPEHAVSVPLRAVSSGGPPVDSEDLGETYSVLHHLYRSERYVIRLSGSSMYPTFHDGDLLLVEPAAKVGENTPAIVRIGTETTVKRVSKRKGGGFFLRADNPLYRPLETGPGEAEVKGRIVCIVEGVRP